MPIESKHTEGGRCQCGIPRDCGLGGCGGGCGPKAEANDLWTTGLLDHTRSFSDDLISTCCDLRDQINFDFGNGWNWLVSAWPYVTDKYGPPVFVVMPPRRPLRFCVAGGGDCLGGGSYIYSPGGCFDCPDESTSGGSSSSSSSSSGSSGSSAGASASENSGDQLRYELSYANNVFTFKDADGSLWKFAGFAPGTVEKGRFKSYQSNGYTAQVTGYTAEGHIQGITFAGDGTTGSLAYTYQTYSDGVERVTSATFTGVDAEGGQHILRRALYTYYAGSSTSSSSSSSGSSGSSAGSGSEGEEYGSTGDLKTVTIQEFLEEEWVTMGTYYYRYYLTANGAHRIKYVVAMQEYENLANDPEVEIPLTASDPKVAQYATYYFEYDADGKLTKKVPLGGQDTTFTYEDGDQTDTDFNKFKLKTVETQADGHQRTHYTNFQGQTILEEVKESASATESSLNYREYDADGNLTLHATPAALAGYSQSGYGIVPQYKSEGGQYNVGLIHVYDYYDETTTGTGGGTVKGFKQLDQIKKGRDGTPVTLRQYEYTQGSYTLTLEGPSSSSSSSSSAAEETVPVSVYPIANETSYRNDDGTGAIETSYGYTFHPGTVQILERVTTLPAVPASQNGSGVSATRTERFDVYGNLVWLKDERGTISYNEYNATGNLTRSIQDVDDTQLTVPGGWSTPTGGGLHLVTDHEYDLRGRQTQSLGPEHNVDGQTVRTASWTVYKDADRETWSGQGYAVPIGSSSSSSSSSCSGFDCDYIYTLVNPVSISKQDVAGRSVESIQAARASTAGKLSSSDSFAQSSYVRWSTSQYNTAGQLVWTRQYHTIPASGEGASGTNYDETIFGYDAAGRQNMTKTPGGTITRTVFDVLGRAIEVYVGTDDTGATDDDPTGRSSSGSGSSSSSSSNSSSSSSSSGAGTNNMVIVSESVYAGPGGCTGCGGGGAGQLAVAIRYVDAVTTRSTEYLYDWRNRQQYTVFEADDAGRVTFTRNHFDNLDRAVRSERYHDVAGDGVDPDSEPSPDDVLIARQETFFDDRGRPWQTRTYAVNPATGAVGSHLAGYTWYDEAGNTVKTQPAGASAFTKTLHDSLGRPVKQYTGYDLSEPVGWDESTTSSSSSSSSSSTPDVYTPATNVDGDTILEQTETTYDAAGNVIQTTRRERYHNATGTGELTSPSGSQPKARVTYTASWHDGIGRTIAVANYGTFGGATFTRPEIVPERTDTILVTSTEYDQAGSVQSTTNPAGIVTRLEHDDAGRQVRQIVNYQAGSSSSSAGSSSSDGDCPASDDTNVTVETAYNADGKVSSITAVNPTTGNQTTQYVYGTTLDDSDVAMSTLKRAEIHPDSSDADDRITFSYNRQGQRTQVTDQQGTVHAFDYDNLGRETQDRVTTLGDGVDAAVRRIATTYEVRGMKEKITSYDNATVGSGSVVNESQFSYNDFGQVTTDYQEHGAAVNTGTSPKVQYGYADGSDNTIRPTTLTYPNERVLAYSYGSSGSTDDALSRVAALVDDDGGSTHLADYSYLGRNSFVEVDYTEPDLRYTLVGTAGGNDPDTGDIYLGLDRFGRIKDSYWYDYGASTDADRIKYGYDRNGSRTYREQTVDPNSDFDEVYSYDSIDRLKALDRGTLTAQKDSVTDLNFAECWGLDATGNWRDFRRDDDGGGWELIQQRTSNTVNEITDIAETRGLAWITPLYNRAGNMTRIPQPSDPTQYCTATYDAWNRLTKIVDGENTLAEYEYDGAKRRTVKKTYSGGVLDETRHFYYTKPSRWQVVEERINSSTDPERQFVWGLRYVDDLLLRDRDTDSNGTLDERLYDLQDANWNVTTLADTSGTIQERYAYSAYGAVAVLAPSYETRPSSSYTWSHRYTGRELDLETGEYSFRLRYYSANLGEFLSRDPAGYANNMNVRGFAGAEPVGRVDPMGTDFIAIADRPVHNTRGAFRHYSVEYWLCCRRPFPKLRHRSGFSREEIGKLCQQPGLPGYSGAWAAEIASIELLVNKTWKAWAENTNVPGQFHILTNIEISEIRYNSDTADRIMPVLEGDPMNPVPLAVIWVQLVRYAQAYPYAEQEGFETANGGQPLFENWPASLYERLGVNSNTFVTWLMTESEIGMTDMTGNHPGWDKIPQPNTRGGWRLFPDSTPWKTGPDKPPPI